MSTYTRDEPLLRIEGVTKWYGAREALGVINLTVNNLHCSDAGRCVGQVIAFIGPSGCGKSTLMRLIAGLEAPNTGRIRLDDSATAIQAGEVGMVFQSYPMSRNRTVRGNLELAGRVAGMTAEQARERAESYISMFRLDGPGFFAGDGVENQYPAQISGGMRQRVAIARQLMNMDGPSSQKTRVLLMDEPFSALDPPNISRLCRLLRKVADTKDNNTVIVVTHDIRAALSVADQIWVMARGVRPDGVRGGGVIVRDLDLAGAGLKWDPWAQEARPTSAFQDLEAELYATFETL